MGEGKGAREGEGNAPNFVSRFGGIEAPGSADNIGPITCLHLDKM